jgi:hypothetical protein
VPFRFIARQIPALLIAGCLGAALVGCGGTQRKATTPPLLRLLQRDSQRARHIIAGSTKATKGFSGPDYTIVDGSEFPWIPRATSASRADLAALEAYKPTTPQEARAKPYFIRVFRLGLAEMRELQQSDAALQRRHHYSRSAVSEPLRRASALSKQSSAAFERGARELGVKLSAFGNVRVRVRASPGYRYVARH